MSNIFSKFLLIGSLFYKGDKKVIDHKKGIINENALKRELKKVKILKEKTGINHALDVIAETPIAMENYIEILQDLTKDPIFIGGLNEETRIAGYKKAKELGIKCGVNAITPNTTDYELEKIKESGIEYAIIQAIDPSAIYPEEKISLIRDCLLEKCKKANIKEIAVDVGILDITSTWLAFESIKLIKKELNLPAGCAPSNIAYQLLTSKKVNKTIARSINIALSTMLQLANADFIIYGPLRAASYVFEPLAIIEGIKAYGEKLKGGKVEKDHPFYKLLMSLR
jgi:tetrahydromethanopterin S-methyltransferase subunit H